MGQENSVMFALRDLRTLESDRVAEEARIAAAAAERRRAEEERRRADEEERRAEEAGRRLAQERAEAEAARAAQALREAAGRNQQLESDVQTLRALVTAVQPAAPARSRWPFVLVAVGALALAGALWTRRPPPVVQERVVYAPAPVALAPVAPPVVRPVERTPAPAAIEPAQTKRTRGPRTRKPSPANVAPLPLPSVLEDCGGKDPLCGTHL
jgi:hypothetical protein